MLNPVNNFYLGGDPEGFFERDGVIIGSEKLIPEVGLVVNYRKVVVRDGIQFELNPAPMYSINGFGQSVKIAFESLKQILRKHPEVKLNWSGLVEVGRAELDTLSDESRILGCQPSKNAYGEFPITVDGETYTKRSAGGHFHFGILDLFHKDIVNIQRLVPYLDIFVGNTGVLFDRDPGAPERRANYGRAGEYRLPDHGLEYRTLSNFWLRNYTLFHLMSGMSLIALSALKGAIADPSIEGELIEVVDLGHVRQAIDTNNYDLARANFERLIPFLERHLPATIYDMHFPIVPASIPKLLALSEDVRDRGIEVVFPIDPLDAWTTKPFVSFNQYVGGL